MKPDDTLLACQKEKKKKQECLTATVESLDKWQISRHWLETKKSQPSMYGEMTGVHRL